MSDPSEVQRYLDGLSHPRHADIAALRAAILASDPHVSECVKWNAPSFRYRGEDRATFRLHPRAQFQVVLHRGSAANAQQPPAFETDSDLVVWAAPDRGVIDVPADDRFGERFDELVALVRAWARS